MIAFALALLALLRGTEPYGSKRRILSVLFCVCWMEVALRRWPEHKRILHAAAMLAAQGDLLGAQLGAAWGILVPVVSNWMLYFVPFYFAAHALGGHPSLVDVFVRVAPLAMATVGYGVTHAADTRRGMYAGALLDAAGVHGLVWWLPLV